MVCKYLGGEKIFDAGLFRRADRGPRQASVWQLQLVGNAHVLNREGSYPLDQFTRDCDGVSIPGSFEIQVGCCSKTRALVQRGVSSGQSCGLCWPGCQTRWSQWARLALDSDSVASNCIVSVGMMRYWRG